MKHRRCKAVYISFVSVLLLLAASTHSFAEDDNGARQPPSGVTVERTLEALGRLAETAFSEALAPFMTELAATDLRHYDDMAARQEAFSRMSAAVNQGCFQLYNDALRIVCRDLRDMDVPLLSVTHERMTINWQETAAMYRVFGSGMASMLAKGFLMDLRRAADGAEFICSFPDNEGLFGQGARSQLYAARAALAYLYTVYTDTGQVKEYQTPVLSQEYLATLVHPLPGCTIKNGWYAPRDRSTRFHMGTDILAPGGTPILSVTDGVVLYVGYSNTPGYYIIIRDPYGYEYHYYHMQKKGSLVNEDDTVRAGQPIGLVGNTGNSSANHLHLGIVTPEGGYINPYDVFVQAGIGPIRQDP